MNATVAAERPALCRGVAVAAAAVVVVGLVAVVGHQPPGLGPGEARLEVDGRARVMRVDGSTEVVTDSARLREGDEVEARRGTMRLLFEDGTSLEGRSAFSDGDGDTHVRVGAVPELLDGELVVVASGGATVEAAGNELRLAPSEGGDSAARLHRSLAVGVAAYAGTVVVDSAGQERTVPALRQIEVAVLGSPPAAPRPLRYDETDPWDLRFLGGAIELSRRLDALAGAYSDSLEPGEGRTVGFYELVLPDLDAEADFTADLLDPERDQGETLVGAAISALGRQDTFVQRWRSVFSFRDAGAEWGLVALDQGVSSAPLVQGIETALAATPFEFAGASPLTPAPATTLPTAPTSSPPSPSTPIPRSPTTTEPLRPRGDEEDDEADPPEAPANVLPDIGVPVIDDAVDPIDELLGGLIGPDDAVAPPEPGAPLP